MKNNILIIMLVIIVISLVACKKNNEELPEIYTPNVDEITEGEIVGIADDLTTDGVVIYKPDEIKETDITVEYNGEIVQYNEKYNKGETGDAKVITFRERSLVPLRELAEKLDYDIAWDGAGQKQALTIQGQGVTIISTLNSNKFFITKDGVSQTIFSETPTIKYDGKIYVPTRFVGETFGVDVEWNNTRRVVEITN